MPIYQITPNDVLFFRDARPMSGSSSGHGARWPEPNILFDALHAALHRAFVQPTTWEHYHVGQPATETGPGAYDKRFGSLQTFGPFPTEGDRWFFPRPQDVIAEGMLRPLTEAAGQSNRRSPLKYTLASNAVPSKEEVAPWWDKAAFDAYLKGQSGGVRKQNKDFFVSEWTTGIGINPDSRTQDGERIYSAEYLRLEKDVGMGLLAAMPLEKDGGDGLDQLFIQSNRIIVGGQQRVCQVEKTADCLETILPIAPAPESCGEKVKWVLLSPAFFPKIPANSDRNVTEHPGGWLPNWVALDGRVMLRDGPGERKAKRKGGKSSRELNVHLVAARIPKPIAISGWSERKHLNEKHGVTPTVLAVPAGAVYYFEGPDAPLLANLLNWHGTGRDVIVNRRSGRWGEKGFGIGVCGTWEAFR